MNFKHLIAALCLSGLAITSWAAPITHTVTIQGKVAGKQTLEVLPGNKLKVMFTYRDNGRGPDVFEDITLGSNGQIEKLVTTGKSTFGAPIEESFTRNGTKATWKSKADSGSSDDAKGLYLPIESSLELSAIAARSLLLAPGNKLSTLPGGQLLLKKMTTATVTNNKKQSRKAVLYSIMGFGLQPAYLWMWDGAKPGPLSPAMLGVVNPGFSVLESGWEGNEAALLDIQKKVENTALMDLAKTLARRFEEPVVFRNVHWFDSEAAQRKGPADVHVYRGRIAAILPPNTPLQDAAQVIDGTGRTLVPGLFDMHVHTGSWDAVLQLAGGVTSVRDMGNINEYLNEIKTRIDAGSNLGPHIIAAGYIEGASQYQSTGGFVIKDVDEGKKAIDWYAQHGYRQIKLYNSIRPEWVAPLAAHAHARGLRVGGHIPAFMRAEEAVRDGFDEIQHINQVMLNFLVKKDDDTRTLLRFYLVGDNANQIDLDGAVVKDFIKLLVERKTTIDPTMTAFESMYLQRQGAPNPSFNVVSPNMPVSIRRAWLTNSMDVNEKNAEPFSKSWQTLLGLVKRMYDAGIPLVAGSDDIAGFTLHRELEIYVQAGLTPAQALQVATRNGARVAGVSDRTGQIAVGKDADLILVEGDPTRNISDLRKVSLTMKAGAVHLPSEIYSAMGVKPFVEGAKVVKTAKPAN
jgi:Amidohydrolase family